LGTAPAAVTARHIARKDAFDFNQPPQRFKKIPAVLSKEYFMLQPIELRIRDAE
jgi:hypothetical protein